MSDGGDANDDYALLICRMTNTITDTYCTFALHTATEEEQRVFFLVMMVVA